MRCRSKSDSSSSSSPPRSLFSSYKSGEFLLHGKTLACVSLMSSGTHESSKVSSLSKRYDKNIQKKTISRRIYRRKGKKTEKKHNDHILYNQKENSIVPNVQIEIRFIIIIFFSASIALLIGASKGGNYVYDGLYVVEEYWQETGSHGKLVFKYKLKRIPGQPELSWKVVKQTKKSENREGLCRLDISEGHERLPICAVNEIDDEEHADPSKGMRLHEAMHGEELDLRVWIRFKLEIFKTESRGWGVSSLSSIPSGVFICEYVGELLEDKEAERRTGNDEYLFDIGNKYDNTLAEGMSKLIPGMEKEKEEEDGGDGGETTGFTVDAAKKGNIGRFINHSCSPNLYAQNVLYDHEDKRIPHVMLFAMDNIPPLQELTYHYNYMIDQVRDVNGNIKKKICYCGSSECTGRLY
ncbi:unnamed protein product [Thlaspi arvense]|uniref:Uncharacterized protein n=1 Tax=Thlaspi arvense TaxID=13288 RepID=A0AAU9SC02_THLAR|nr:unnamed protein product [Thlaspi arvense]